MSTFADAYRRASRDSAGVSGALESADFINEVEIAIGMATDALAKEAGRRANVGVDYVKGNLAEVWHAETLNVSAVAKRADDVFACAVGTNKTGQDVLYGSASGTSQAELKYYKTAEETARQLGNPAYSSGDKIVPSDQLDGVIAESMKQAERNREGRPDVAAAYQNTADSVSDRLEVGGASSKPLSEADAKGMATDFKRDGKIDPEDYGLNTEGFVEWSDIFRESGSAVLNAAAFSAAVTAAPHVHAILAHYLKSGEFDPALMREGASQVFSSAGAAAVRGGLAAVITGSCKAGLMGRSLKSVSPTAVGMATAMALNSIENTWRYAQGEISGKELAFLSSRDAVALIAGGGFAVLGQMIIPIPVFGALLGNLVGSTLGSMGVNYANSKVLGICVESGWTFFGLVEQSYSVPEEVLKSAGFDIFARKVFASSAFNTPRFKLQPFAPDSVGFTLLRRGVIGFNTVGYL